MKHFKSLNARRISIVGFSFLFAYILSFQFEGQVLYSVLELWEIKSSDYILVSTIAHFMGLLTCGLFVKSSIAAKKAVIASVGISLAAGIPFFFRPSILWMLALIVSGYASGCAVAVWGYYLKEFTPKNRRIKSCADVLIYSNIIMILVNILARNVSAVIGLVLSMLCLVVGIFFINLIPVELENIDKKTPKSKTLDSIKAPLLLLCFFIFIITINSGLMYQVINPAFADLTGIISWYWAVPYIIALAIMRNLPMRVKRSRILYLGMVMIMAAFISFMKLGRNPFDYIIVDTLMLGACGIFDLFWWSILGEMLDYTDNPVHAFGIGLSANVLGVFFGGALGMAITSIGLIGAEVAVIALSVVCITLVMLPPLNRQLVLLLKSNTYLTVYDTMSQSKQTDIIKQMKTLDPLTSREEEVLQLLLLGQSNRNIAEGLFISESTVKTHVRNIFSKYDVGSRAELISIMLKNQTSE